MQVKSVPQDDENFYAGHQRAVYAQQEDGTYVQTLSKGWRVETYFTSQALIDIEKNLNDAVRKVEKGEWSTLAVHMQARMMTPKLLAQHVGYSVWRVKHHLKPKNFCKLAPDQLKVYAQVLDLSVEQLVSLTNLGDYGYDLTPIE
jgi:hypothetical protein